MLPLLQLGFRSARSRIRCSPGVTFFANSYGRTSLQVEEDAPQSLSSATGASAPGYHLRITTGRRRGAGTNDPIAIQLVGSRGTSQKFLLDKVENPFERGSSLLFKLPVQEDLGPLRRLHVEKLPGVGYDPGGGWYLRQIETENLQTGERVLFPCNSWLGDSDCGAYQAPTERNLLPAVATTSAHHEPVHVTAAGLAIPHPEKVHKKKGVNQQGMGHGGEDAYFYCSGRNQLFGIGVADGIYGWREKGIDSGIMAQALMQRSMAMIQSGVEDVFKVLQTSARHVVSSGLQGSSTACVLTINQDNGQLRSANLGDSGFMVLGRNPASERGMPSQELRVKFRTNQMEHEFGRPLQLGHHEHASRPEDADLASFHVSKGDLVVAGTDGLLDNVNEGQIIVALTQLVAQGAGPSKMVQTLVKMAFEASLDKRADTPYSRDASEAFNMVYMGGKPDDITVVVAQCK